MSKFTYDDIVTVRNDAPAEFRPGMTGWIVAVLEDRRGDYFKKFPVGMVYSVEFEDGEAIDIHESNLELRDSCLRE